MEHKPVKALRYIYESLPDVIRFSAEPRGRQAEVIILLLDDENEAGTTAGGETADSRSPPKNSVLAAERRKLQSKHQTAVAITTIEPAQKVRSPAVSASAAVLKAAAIVASDLKSNLVFEA